MVKFGGLKNRAVGKAKAQLSGAQTWTEPGNTHARRYELCTRAVVVLASRWVAARTLNRNSLGSTSRRRYLNTACDGM